MELFTFDRKFLQQDEIDVFNSAIWTERYYGNSEVELVVPLTQDSLKKLAPGIFLGLLGSDEVMILETMDIKEGKITFTGISLLSWLNNRFIRTSASHSDKQWKFGPGTPGWALWAIIWNMCHKDSPYLKGTIPMGVPNPQQFIIPGLELKDYDNSGTNLNYVVDYGPVYSALYDIATTHRIGMQITLESANDTSYVLGFRSYKGLDRTSGQTVNPPVRFSPQMDSLTNIHELQSIAALKTQVYSYISDDPKGLATLGPGVANLTGPQYTGFDLRASTISVDNVNEEGLTAQQVLDILNIQAASALSNSPVAKLVDGEIVPTNQYKYGIDYNLGDIIEVQGNSQVISTSRVTEHIRSQDEAGERSYPTVAMLE